MAHEAWDWSCHACPKLRDITLGKYGVDCTTVDAYQRVVLYAYHSCKKAGRRGWALVMIAVSMQMYLQQAMTF